MDLIRVIHWNRYQHYKNRNPPWIKLHRELLTSPTWVSCDDSTRVLAIAIMLLAAQTDNKIPADPKYLQRVAYLNKLPNLKPLLDVQFIEYIDRASDVLAPCASTEKETEQRQSREETEKETEPTHVLILKKEPFGEFGNVRLTVAEHQKLVGVFGDDGTRERIHSADLYFGSKGNGSKYKSHYLTILNWDRKNGNGGNGHVRTESPEEAKSRRTREASERILARLDKQTRGSLPS